MTDEKKREVGYLFALAYSMGEGASLTLSGNFNIGASKEFMDAELDKCYSVMERQRAKVKIEVIREKVRIQEKDLEQISDQVGELTAVIQEAQNNKKLARPNDATTNALKTQMKNQDIIEYNIRTGKEELAALEKIIG